MKYSGQAYDLPLLNSHNEIVSGECDSERYMQSHTLGLLHLDQRQYREGENITSHKMFNIKKTTQPS